MSVENLVARLRALDVSLALDGDRLRVNAPKGVLTDELRQELSANKGAILDALRAEAAAPAQDSGIIPLSFAQERFWFLEQMVPGLAAYNITGALRLVGRLDIPALHRVLTEIVRRHDTLRSTFHVVDDRPAQIIHAPAPVPLPLIDVSAMLHEDRERRILEIATEHARRSFDLSGSPPIRAALIRVAPDQHVLMLATHHIVSDGWSMGVFVMELVALYTAFSAGRPSPLPDLKMQYADYARWQRQHLEGPVLDRQIEYWAKQLGGDIATIDLPTDRPRPLTLSPNGAVERFSISKALTDRLRALARREQSTLFMVLLGAYQVLLSRYTGLTDIPVGTPIANRTRLEIEGLIGFFANTLVMRTDLSGAPSFREVLRRVRIMALDAYANQDLPFGKVVEVVQPVRDVSRTPLFQVMFAVNNAPIDTLTLPGLTLSPIGGERGTSKTDLSLEMFENGDGILGALEYGSDLFDPPSIRRLWRHYEALLEAVTAHPERSIADIPLLSAQEERQIVIDWNDTALDHDRTRGLHTLLEESARRTPDAIAVIAGETTLDYRTLDERANQLARVLVARGVKAGGLVAICLDRTADMPIAMAAVLKAGCAYVPLDPSHPADRLRLTLEDAQVACVVAHARFTSHVESSGAPLVLIDEIEAECAVQPTTPPDVTVRPEDLAYVIYTSGSTGRPKGVEVEHRNIVSFLTAMQKEPGLGPKDALLAVTTLSFDIAGLELWLPLTVGARVVLASRTDVLDPERLMTLLSRYGITVMQATPATWRLLLEGGWSGNRDLRVFCGGEALPRDLADTLRERVRELWNLYGPTETTVWSTAGRVGPGEDAVPIGRPIANTRIYVLDVSGRPAPIGVPGELCIAGEGVARGYRNLPEMTAEKFVRLDIPVRGTERVYRTGDMARWRADGTVQFIGRRDGQVKVRGYRIELGEVESVLRTHPGVADCAVVVRQEESGEVRLVAYAVTDDATPLSAEGARATLRDRLPEYMVPPVFVTLPQLPLTPNGKVDRKALSIKALPDETRDERIAVLMTPAQRRVANIWETLLGSTAVGLHNNFFDLGGHSLLAVRLHGALRREFGVEFPLIDLFQHTTVAAQAERLAALATLSTGEPMLAATEVAT